MTSATKTCGLQRPLQQALLSQELLPQEPLTWA